MGIEITIEDGQKILRAVMDPVPHQAQFQECGYNFRHICAKYSGCFLDGEYRNNPFGLRPIPGK